MASRGNGNNDRGRGRGSPFNRGRPGRGRGSPRGRGRGSQTPIRGATASPLGYRNMGLIDVDIQLYADESSGYDSPSQRGRGRGRGRGFPRGRANVQNFMTFGSGSRPAPPPRPEPDSGAAIRGTGRRVSRGLGASYNSNNMPLSKLLALDRPYLRPITFVPAQLTPVLFQREEEMIEAEQVIEAEDHVPTADRVARVFSHQKPPQQSFFYSPEDDNFGTTDSEPVVTVDFRSLGKLLDDSRLAEAKVPGPAPTLPTSTGGGTSIFDAIKDALAGGTGPLLDTVPPIDSGASQAKELGVLQQQAVGGAIVTSVPAETSVSQTSTILSLSLEDAATSTPLFVTDPNPISSSDTPAQVDYTPATVNHPLGSNLPEDDEVIVYIAPHPRSGRATPGVPSVPYEHKIAQQEANLKTEDSLATSSPTAPTLSSSFNTMSFSFNAVSSVAEANRRQIASPHSRRLTKKDRHMARRTMKRKGTFASFGALLEEKHLHEGELRNGRREGSDIDWGDSDGQHNKGDSELDRVSSSLGGMDLDSDIDQEAMKNFLKGMSKEGMEYTRIDDLEDAEKLRLEDEDDEGGTSRGSSGEDSEADIIVNTEEKLLIAEADAAEDSESDTEEEDDVSSDEDETPKRSFQARLEKMRLSARSKKESTQSIGLGTPEANFQARLERARAKGKGKPDTDSEDSDSDVDESDDFETWAEQDEGFYAEIQKLLDENDDILNGRDRKQKKAMFNAIRDGEFTVTPATKKRNYDKNLPPELRAQWEGDRAKKAENKRKRALARLEAAADPLAPRKGGKKGRKATLRATRLLAEADAELPIQPTNRATDIPALVRQIRVFLADIGGRAQMPLPPMDKESRAKVHEIADAFGLKSVSKGRGETRYTTLIRKSRSGVNVNERKIERIIRSGGDWGFTRPGNPGFKNGGKASAAPRHRDGDEVGKAAPKIGEGNIGFQMLASMGWSEGTNIGMSGGIDAPLTAIIKNTKLGLGATR